MRARNILVLRSAYVYVKSLTRTDSNFYPEYRTDGDLGPEEEYQLLPMVGPESMMVEWRSWTGPE